MKKKFALAVLLVLAVVALCACSNTTAELTARADANHLGSFTFAISGQTQGKEDVTGTYTYTVSSGKYTTASGDINDFVIDTVNGQTVTAADDDGNPVSKTYVLTSQVKTYESLRPLTCQKKLVIDNGATPGWTSTCTYDSGNAAVSIVADDKTLLQQGEGDVDIPLQGAYYDSEEILMLVRGMDLTVGTATLQSINIQSGVSDFLTVVVAEKTEKITALGGEYDCKVVSIGSSSLFTKPEIVIWLTNDVNRLPVKFTQGNTIFTLTSYQVD